MAGCAYHITATICWPRGRTPPGSRRHFPVNVSAQPECHKARVWPTVGFTATYVVRQWTSSMADWGTASYRFLPSAAHAIRDGNIHALAALHVSVAFRKTDRAVLHDVRSPSIVFATADEPVETLVASLYRCLDEDPWLAEVTTVAVNDVAADGAITPLQMSAEGLVGTLAAQPLLRCTVASVPRVSLRPSGPVPMCMASIQGARCHAKNANSRTHCFRCGQPLKPASRAPPPPKHPQRFSPLSAAVPVTAPLIPAPSVVTRKTPRDGVDAAGRPLKRPSLPAGAIGGGAASGIPELPTAASAILDDLWDLDEIPDFSAFSTARGIPDDPRDLQGLSVMSDAVLLVGELPVFDPDVFDPEKAGGRRRSRKSTRRSRKSTRRSRKSTRRSRKSTRRSRKSTRR